jgi:hypothetical protein
MQPGDTADRTVPGREPVWRDLDAWASSCGYRLTDWRADHRVYRKPHRLRRRRGCWTVSVDRHRHGVHVTGSIVPMRFAGKPPDTAALDAGRDVDRLLESLGTDAPV